MTDVVLRGIIDGEPVELLRSELKQSEQSWLVCRPTIEARAAAVQHANRAKNRQAPPGEVWGHRYVKKLREQGILK